MLELKRIYWKRLGLRLAFAAATMWLFASAILSLMPKMPAGDALGPSTVTEVLRGLTDGVVAAVTLPGVVVVALTIAAAVTNARDVRRRDPVRRFSRQQRREGMARADGQCEMEAGFRRRCSRPAEHGDHFYPWSKGGSTTLQNFVAACARCNRAKGAGIPSPGKQERLERRRRGYLMPDAFVSVGERQPLPDRRARRLVSDGYRLFRPASPSTAMAIAKARPEARSGVISLSGCRKDSLVIRSHRMPRI
jgi:5-methylcytosine-specific restriction endonuclease McrA